MSPIVSVVVPAHNKGGTVRAAIESVLRQTIQDTEIVVVDDGSTDDTREQVQPFGPRVRYIYQPQSGVSAARNRGIEATRAEFVAFLDADDLWLPNKLERQLEVLKQESGINAVQCSVYLVNNQLEVVDARRCDPSQDSWLDLLLFRNLPGVGSTLVARRSRLQALGGFATDLVILEDWDLACRLARTGGLRSLPEFLVLYRQYVRNRSRNVGIHIEPGFRSLSRLFADPMLPQEIRRHEARVWARFFAMLAGGFIQNRQWRQGLRWSWKALRTSPQVGPYFAGVPIRRLQRWRRAREKWSFADELSFAVNPSR